MIPAVNEINEHGEEGGFFVGYEGVRRGQVFQQDQIHLVRKRRRAMSRDGVFARAKARPGAQRSMRRRVAAGAVL